MQSLAFIFPGQGSQSIGMLGGIAAPIIHKTFEQASHKLGYDLWALTQNGPEDKLNQTQFTQPALLAAGVALFRLWQEQGGVQPSYMAGHSLGEYTALVCSGAVDFLDALSLVSERGRLMQQAVPQGEGAMAAIIGMDNEGVEALCHEVVENQEVLAAVNYNAVGQVVIAGHKTAVVRAMGLAKEKGARMAVPLPVSVPSHCALMKDAAQELAVAIDGLVWKTPSVKVIHNVDVQSHENLSELKDSLVKQLYNPVRWVETIQYLSGQGVTQFVECGPGKVLTGLNKRIDKSFQSMPIGETAALQAAHETLQCS